MGWSLGYDTNWKRDVGYGVPAYCDQPGCTEEIHRGLAYVCGGHPFGGDRGCGLYFCGSHMYVGGREGIQLCKRCLACKPARVRISPEHPEWVKHKLTDESWAEWRTENPAEVAALERCLSRACGPEDK